MAKNTTLLYVENEMRTVNRLYMIGAISAASVRACVAPWLRALEIAERPDRQLPEARR